jgi:hypothetical protein
LEQYVQLSRNSEVSQEDSQRIISFLKETNARVFYYAVNVKTLDRCRAFAKKRYIKLAQRYGSEVATNVPADDNENDGGAMTQSTPADRSPSLVTQMTSPQDDSPSLNLSSSGLVPNTDSYHSDNDEDLLEKNLGKATKRPSSVAFPTTSTIKDTATDSNDVRHDKARPAKKPKVSSGELNVDPIGFGRESTPPPLSFGGDVNNSNGDNFSQEDSVEYIMDDTQNSQVWTTKKKTLPHSKSKTLASTKYSSLKTPGGHSHGKTTTTAAITTTNKTTQSRKQHGGYGVSSSKQ